MIVYLSHAAAPGAQRNPARRRAAPRLAALAASASLVAIASPAYAQCVEGPPNTYSCSGTTNVPQAIADDDATVVAAPNFEVDTSGNGNGTALQVTGNGLISFTGAPDLTGAGVHFTSTGDSGLSAGGISLTASGRIFANGSNGLHLENYGSGAISALWGRVDNSGGNGVLAQSYAGSGELFMLIGRVNARDTGIAVGYDGNASVIVQAFLPVFASTGTGVDITAGGASDGIDLTVGEVTGGNYGIDIGSAGSGLVKVDATGTVTGMGAHGILASSGTNALGIDIRAVDVNGGAGGIVAYNDGGNVSIAATGHVIGAGFVGIDTFNWGTGGSVSINAVDVTGTIGIHTNNNGGTTSVFATGDVVGFDGAGIDISANGNNSDVLVEVRNVEGMNNGIVVSNLGTGSTVVRSNGIVTGTNDGGIVVDGDVASTGIEIFANQVNGNVAGISTDNQGSGDTLITATGAVSSQGDGILAVHGTSARDISITATDVSGFYGIRTSNAGTGATSITATGLVSGADYGIVADNVGGSTDLNIRAATVVANGIGIEVENSGSGTTNVVVDTVTGLGDVGVRVTATGSAGSVDLTIGDATSLAGAVISNSGSGAARLTATGTVTGVDSIGINVGNQAGATDIEIHANNVNAGSYFGVLGLNQGTGDTLIETTGLVAVTGLYGIIGMNEATARNMTVSAVDVIAGRGLSITNLGTGTTDVVSTGTITGYGSEGVVVGNEGTAGDMRVDVNVVNGNTRGMRILNSGVGTTSIRAGGTVTATAGSGIEAAIGATAQDLAIDVVDVTGTSGIRIDNQGLGTTRVAATGTVTGTSGDGINVFAFTQADDVEIAVADVTGGTGGVNVTNYGTGSASITATGTVSALAADGYGIVVETGTGSTDIRIAAVDVLGNAGGIVTQNLGSGETAITSTGTVTGGFTSGIFARNEGTSTNIKIAANNVQGAETGMLVVNQGTGTTSISASGLVTGTNVAGIDARAGITAQSLTVSAVDVTGASGILVQNFGQGSAGISATGTVTALDAAGTGIAVVGGTGSTDLSVASARVIGGERGIDTVNDGSGDTLILAGGLVTGSEIGIRARNGAGADGLGIRTAEVQSAGIGILAENLGTGRTVVRADGAVIGQGEAGIAVTTGAASNDVAVLSGTVTGGVAGIWVENGGIGSTSITAGGTVSGTDFGIFGKNDVTATDVTIRAANVQSSGNAVVVENQGSGKTQVVTTGNVAAVTQAGIRVFAGAGADDISVEAVNASGGISGISVVNLGLGDTSVTVNGVVHGGTRGVEAFADGNQRVSIFNNGTIRNSSGLGASRAIGASGGLVGIANAGTLTGIVEIAGDQSLMLNAGTWQSIGGTSLFATIDDTLFNTIGTIVAGVAPGAVETTTWQGLEKFRNGGVLRLQDGGTGDLVLTSAASTFIAGSTLAVDIGGATAADLFRTTGTLQIEAGSRLLVTATQPLVLGGKHVVAQADGGLTGQFAFEDQFLTAFAGLRDGYTATTAYVEFAQLKPLAAGGLTPNQKETGGGADSLPDGNPLKDALILLPTDAAAQDAFDQLSGEIHPSARGAMFDDARLVRNAVLDRLAGGAPGWSVWGRAFGAAGMNDGDANAARMQRDTKGGVIGIDGSFGAATIGIAGGWSDSDLRIDRRASNGSVETVHAMAYAGANLGPVRLRGGAGYAWTTTQTRRRIAFQGFAAQPHARYKGSVLQAYGEAGYQLPLGGGHVEPFVNLTAVRASTDGFTETGGSPAALTGKAIREERIASTLGLRLETPAAGPVTVRGSIGWNRAWGDLDPVGVHAFPGGAPFTILGAAGSRDSALARFDAQMRLSSNVTLSVGYDGVLGSRGDDHSVTGGLRIVF